MADIKILDCTLRDGGYTNNWNFGKNNISKIIKALYLAKIDFIECGFLTNEPKTSDFALFNSIEKINEILPPEIDKNKITAMFCCANFSAEKVPQYKKEYISSIRLIFKKQNEKKALINCENLIQKGYKVFINPTFISSYSIKDFTDIVKKINKMNPFAFSIVDSTGTFKPDDAFEYFKIANEILDENITICFHSHNNLNFSFENAKKIVQNAKTRKIITDTTLKGIGRCAGNLETELFGRYLNDNFNAKYNLNALLEIEEENFFNSIFKKRNFESLPCKFSAIYRCHPNYALYLIEKNIKDEKTLLHVFQNIPEDKKNTYDKTIIEKLVNLKDR